MPLYHPKDMPQPLVNEKLFSSTKRRRNYITFTLLIIAVRPFNPFSLLRTFECLNALNKLPHEKDIFSLCVIERILLACPV
jgi:hypothetical protein